MVHPNKISDDEVTILSHKVREQIEKNLDYPGNIKVTVIREFRAVDYAKKDKRAARLFYFALDTERLYSF